MDSIRTGQSKTGIAALIFALVPFVGYAVVVPFVIAYLNSLPRGADAVPIAFGLLLLFVLSLCSETLAVGLATIGLVQKQRGRLLAVLGLACSFVAFLTLAYYYFVLSTRLPGVQ